MARKQSKVGIRNRRPSVVVDTSNIEKLCKGDEKTAFDSARLKIGRQIDESLDDDEIKTSILVYSYASLHRLPDYATLDYDHTICLSQVKHDIEGYLDKPSLTRPLNFLVVASPGAGKSQLVKSIAAALGHERAGYVHFNMATMQSKRDLAMALDAARNVAVDGRLPLVFLDEFDSRDTNYALLLPVLWDGELTVGGHALKLVRGVFFLAGSRSSLPDELREARNLGTPMKSKDSKLVDLLSRINGTVIEVPSTAAYSEEYDPRPDKLVIAMALLRRRFAKLQTVPWALLRFIAIARYRYEARSIATLIDLLAMKTSNSIDTMTNMSMSDIKELPLATPEQLRQSPLNFHFLHHRAEVGLVNIWNMSLEYSFDQKIRVRELDTDVGTGNGLVLMKSMLESAALASSGTRD